MRAGTTSYSARSSWQMVGSREKRKEYAAAGKLVAVFFITGRFFCFCKVKQEERMFVFL